MISISRRRWTALAAAAGLATIAAPAPASKKPCRDQHGRVIPCPKPSPAASPRPRDTSGRFAGPAPKPSPQPH